MTESAAGDLGQVADLGTFADPHRTLVIEWGCMAVVVGVGGCRRWRRPWRLAGSRVPRPVGKGKINQPMLADSGLTVSPVARLG